MDNLAISSFAWLSNNSVEAEPAEALEEPVHAKVVVLLQKESHVGHVKLSVPELKLQSTFIQRNYDGVCDWGKVNLGDVEPEDGAIMRAYMVLLEQLDIEGEQTL